MNALSDLHLHRFASALHALGVAMPQASRIVQPILTERTI
jgi:hypothetical protein